MQIKNILIIRFRRVGDSVLSMALCHGLRQSFPDATIDFVINKGIHTLYVNHPDVDNVITFDDEENHNPVKYISKVWKTMHNKHYDIIIDMRGTIKTLWFSLFSLSTPYRIGTKKRYGKGILNYMVDNHNNMLSRVQQNNIFLEPLKKKFDIKASEKFSLYVSDEDRLNFRQYMQNQGIDFNKPVILCTPTARQEYKVWPKEYMKEILSKIIQKYNLQIIFNFSGETEKNCAIAYHKEMNDDSHIFTNIEAKSLTELCALTANCDFFFGNEGGPRHIAQALDIPSFAIFPPGIRKGLWLPKESIRFAGISTEDIMPVDEQDKKELTYEERMKLIDVSSVWKGFQNVFEQNINI